LKQQYVGAPLRERAARRRVSRARKARPTCLQFGVCGSQDIHRLLLGFLFVHHLPSADFNTHLCKVYAPFSHRAIVPKLAPCPSGCAFAGFGAVGFQQNRMTVIGRTPISIWRDQAADRIERPGLPRPRRSREINAIAGDASPPNHPIVGDASDSGYIVILQCLQSLCMDIPFSKAGILFFEVRLKSASG
jgi:hypothetical protein